TWIHLAAVVNGTSISIYVNGQFNNSVPVSHGIFPGTAPLIIGSTLFSGSFFNGLIDEPAIYNRALSTSEIAAIYNASSAGKCPTGPPPTNCVPAASGLVSWWPAEGNASDAVDSNSGTLYGGVAFTSGVVGQAFSFNGSSAHVRVSDRPNLHFTN